MPTRELMALPALDMASSTSMMLSVWPLLLLLLLRLSSSRCAVSSPALLRCGDLAAFALDGEPLPPLRSRKRRRLAKGEFLRPLRLAAAMGGGTGGVRGGAPPSVDCSRR